MLLWGRTDSEHGWAQVVSTAALLAVGQVLVDWQTVRAVGVDGWQVELIDTAESGQLSLRLVRVEMLSPEDGESLFLKVLRLPGAGFGGYMVNIVAAQHLLEFEQRVVMEYRRRTVRKAALHVCRAVEGGSYLPIDT